MMVAARHPERVSRLMVVDMSPFLGAVFVPNATPETVRPIAERMRTGFSSGTAEQRRLATTGAIATTVPTEALRPIAIRHSIESDPAIAGQAMYDLLTTDLRPELARIKVPMAVLWVKAPGVPITDAQMAEAYRQSYAGAAQARLVRVPNAYHFIMWDEPKAFQRELTIFLADDRAQ